MKNFYSSILLVLIIVGITNANIINIPADYPTIQAGIDSATVGDTVLIAENIYVENLVVNKDIILTSTYIFDQDSNSIKNTIIDGDSIDTVIEIGGGAGRGTSIQYLTIRNGYASQAGMGTNGAGLRVYGDAIIQGNIIEDNHTVDGYGGGLHISADSATVVNNIIRNNSAVDSTVGYASGGGISAYGSDIIQNRIYGNWSSSRGGGIYGAGYNLRNNLIYNNSCDMWGGGVMINIGDTWLSNNVIVNNTGAGVYGWSTSPNYQVDVFIDNCVIYGNTGDGYTSSGRVTNFISNSIIYNNSGLEINNVHSGRFYVNYCNIEAGFDSGVGIIDTSSFFINIAELNFQLQANSPCIDTGDPDPANNDVCFPPSLGGIRNDIGAYGGPNACGWLDSTIITSFTENKDIGSEIVNLFKLKQNYPNPFNPRTTIEFSIPKSKFVSLKIYNLLGQEVATLVLDKLTPGNYKYTWDASGFASGVYIYKMQTERGFTMMKKLLLIK